MTTLSYPPAVLAASLEASLGAPDTGDGPLSYRRILESDRSERFPSDACAELDRWGLVRYYVPTAFGGALDDFAAALALTRVVARRDITVAVAHAKTFLGAVPVWLAGRPEQVDRLVQRVLSGSAIALGLTERGHGSDLLATETTAVADAGGFRVSGEKWLINNATRGGLITLLVRTDPAGGPLALSLLMVDKDLLADGEYRCTPKVPTHGIRGADISGIAFHDARVGAGALVGQLGNGMPVLLKSFQLTRTLCAGLSLGAADQALALAVDFCRRQPAPHDGRAIGLVTTRRTLGAAIARLFIAESVSTVGARAVNALPREMSVVASVVKSLVPTLVDGLIEDVGQLLGAHAVFRDAFAGGRFQKVERDHRVVGIFDGSTFVNQNYLINQFARLARAYRSGRVDAGGLRQAVTLSSTVEAFDAARLSLVSPGCSVVQALPEAVADMHGLAARGEVGRDLLAMADELLDAGGILHRELARFRQPRSGVPAEGFALAQRYEWCFAGAACLLLWLHNRERVGSDAGCGTWVGGRWLASCLAVVLDGLGAPVAGAGQGFIDLFDVAEPRVAWPSISILPACPQGGGHSNRSRCA